MRNELGSKLKRLMKARGVRNQDMAAACGVTPGAVSNWFSTGRIDKHNLVAAAKLLGTTADALIGEDIDNLLTGRAMLEPRVVMRAMNEVPPPAQHTMKPMVQAYTLEALSVAASYDRLPDDNARMRVRALISNLEFLDDGRAPMRGGPSPAEPEKHKRSPAAGKPKRAKATR